MALVIIIKIAAAIAAAINKSKNVLHTFHTQTVIIMVSTDNADTIHKHKHIPKLGFCESEIFVRIESRIESAATIQIQIESRIESGCSHLHVQCRRPQELCRPTAYYGTGNYPTACHML